MFVMFVCFRKKYLIFASIYPQRSSRRSKTANQDTKALSATKSVRMQTFRSICTLQAALSHVKRVSLCWRANVPVSLISIFGFLYFVSRLSSSLTWILNGTCADVAEAPCNIKNSNKKPGKACQCLPFHGGKIVWKGAVATGQCQRLWNGMPHADTLGLQ